MNRILIDTDILVDHFRDYKPATRFMEKTSGENTLIAVSVITIAEILSGRDCMDSRILSEIEDFLAPLEKLNVDLDVAKKAAEFRRLYGISLADAIIAATAYKLKAPLYSRNVKHYNKIIRFD